MSALRHALAAVSAVLLLAPAAGAAPPRCTIVGTGGPDRLVGTPGHDVICGRGGRDVIVGRAGNDVIRGGRGRDTIHPGRGDDRVHGGPGNDTIWAQDGSDAVWGGSGNDVVRARDGQRDTVNGGPGRDTVFRDARDRLSAVEILLPHLPPPSETPPTPTIDSGPPEGGASRNRTVTITFSATAPVDFECRLDGGAWTACGSGTRGTVEYARLADGPHSVDVRAARNGKTSAPARRSWRVDTKPPVVDITGAPSSGTSRSATFEYVSSERGTFACSLDGDPFVPCGSGDAGSKTYSGLSAGTHNFRVLAVDEAGNQGSAAQATWNVEAETTAVIAAAGDIACDPANPAFSSGSSGSCRQMATSNLIEGHGYDAVLPLGDNQYYCGGIGSWSGSYDPSWGRFKNITFPVPGNHEYLTHGGSTPSTGCDAANAGAAGYFGYFGARAGDPGKGYYSYDVGSWHLIALNSNCGDAGGCGATSPQVGWLKADLREHRNACTLAYWHVPLYSSGGRAETKTRTFWQALIEGGADVVLNGHDHTYERFALQDANGALDPAQGLREFVVGTGGANHTSFETTEPNSEVRNSTTFGILRLTLLPTSYEWKFVPIAGSSFTDSGETACH